MPVGQVMIRPHMIIGLLRGILLHSIQIMRATDGVLNARSISLMDFTIVYVLVVVTITYQLIHIVGVDIIMGKRDIKIN